MSTGTYIKRAEPMVNKAYIKQAAKIKMDRIISHCPGEVGWFGFVEVKQGFIIVDDIILFNQEVTSASVDTSAADLHAVLEEHAEKADMLKFSGHSHGSLEAYFSGQDVDQIEEWGEYGIPWIISHVQNKKGEFKTRFDQFKPFRMGCDLELITLVPQEIENWVLEELENKVKIVKAEPKKSNTGYGFSPQSKQLKGGTGFGRHNVPQGDVFRTINSIDQTIKDGIIVEEVDKIKDEHWKHDEVKDELVLVNDQSDKKGNNKSNNKGGGVNPKAPAPNGAVKHQTPPPSGAKRSSDANKKSSQPSSQQQPVLTGISSDAVLSDDEAAKYFYTGDSGGDLEEVPPVEVTSTSQFVGEVEKEDDDDLSTYDTYEGTGEIVRINRDGEIDVVEDDELSDMYDDYALAILKAWHGIGETIG